MPAISFTTLDVATGTHFAAEGACLYRFFVENLRLTDEQAAQLRLALRDVWHAGYGYRSCEVREALESLGVIVEEPGW